jgi:hypothetical protein
MKKTHASETESYTKARGVVESGGEKRENYHSFSPTAAEAESPCLSFAARRAFYLIGIVTLTK